jgi:hypothetical protein
LLSVWIIQHVRNTCLKHQQRINLQSSGLNSRENESLGTVNKCDCTEYKKRLQTKKIAN